MRVLKALLIVVLCLAVLAACAWALVRYAGLEGSLLWTAIVGALAWAIRSNTEKKQEHLRLLGEKKREHYVAFLEFMNLAVSTVKSNGSSSKESGSLTSPAKLDEFRKWSLRLTLIGSDEVVRAWNAVRVAAPEPREGLDILKDWGRLWLEMRKDCGHDDTKLTVADVLASIVNDMGQAKDKLSSR
jgi:hypothetical protein